MHGVSSVVSSSVSLKLSVLIPLIFAVLLLLSVAASLLAWRMVKQREKGELAWLGLGWVEVYGASGRHCHPGAIWPRDYPHDLEGTVPKATGSWQKRGWREAWSS